MAKFKTPKIGVYGPLARSLQKTISYEKTSLTWHPVNVFKYLGSRANEVPDITDIQDPILLENPDRAYETSAIPINAQVEFLPESQFDLSRFGIINPLGNTTQFKIHINSFAADGMGRYLMPADIIEVPFWLQDGNKSYWEVNDVDRKDEFEHYYVVITASPVKDSQETEEITDIYSNADLLADLGADINAEHESVFTQGGLLLEPSLYVARDYVVDDYVDPANTHVYADEGIRDDYDVRSDEAASFLDDPTKKIL